MCRASAANTRNPLVKQYIRTNLANVHSSLCLEDEVMATNVAVVLILQLSQFVEDATLFSRGYVHTL